MQGMYSKLEELLETITDNKIIPAISVAIGKHGDIVYAKSFGSVFETCEKVTNKFQFDIASITKVLTGICFMKAVEEGEICLTDYICDIFPEFHTMKPIEKNGIIVDWCDATKITWKHVLTHTSGMGWARPKTRPSLPHLDNGLDDIYGLPFVYQPGTQIVYSDIPIILMGKALEKKKGVALDQLVKEELCDPLELRNTGYHRISIHQNYGRNVVPTENDTVFRKRRIWGEVHDENAFLLDGVSAHAGIFSTAEDMVILALAYAKCLKQDGILKKETANLMITEQANADGDRRGLIWQLSGSGENAYTRYLSSKAYGHAGFTGCFFWNDPENDVSIVLLSNDVYNGRDSRKLFKYRPSIMEVIMENK